MNALFFIFRRDGQSKNRNLPHASYVCAAYLFGIGEIEGLAGFAAVYLGVWAPGFFRVTTGLLDYISGIKPTLQMAAAEFSLVIFFVTSALSRLLGFYLMMGKLLDHWGCRSSCGHKATSFQCVGVIAGQFILPHRKF